MELTRDEQEMLEGKEGLDRQKAMELLIKYGDALGAKRFINTDNVYVDPGAFPYLEVVKGKDVDDAASKFFLDSSERVVVDRVKAFTIAHVFTIDWGHWRLVGASESLRNSAEQMQIYCRRIGINLTCTCAPYLCGVVPVFGEHCAWVESSAIAYVNAIIGARTNINGLESAFASALTGKTPYWGLHLDENRLATIQVSVDLDLDSIMEHDLLGYYVGGVVGLDIPVYTNVRRTPSVSMLMALSAAGATSGSIGMFHIAGVTPEARTLEEATGNKKPKMTINYGAEERKKAYGKLNKTQSENVNIVDIGCPHYTLQQLGRVARLLEGKKIHENILLLIHTAKQLKTVADRNGYTDIITKAGGHLLIDSCVLNIHLPASNVIATDAAKCAHYLSGEGYDNIRYGTMEDCIQAAITSKWKGELK